MQLRVTKILSVLLAVLLTASLGLAAFAAQDSSADAPATQITVRASEIQARGAYKAIQTALNAAHYSATKDNIFKITVEPGTYDLRSALHIYSNTTLSLYNVTLIRNKESISNMIRTGDDTAVNKGGTGYSPNSNITVEGGKLDGGGTSNTMIKVTHASNFRMIGTDVINVKNAHMMEVAAVDGFDIRSCTFRNQLMDATAVGYEAIQLDIPQSGHIVGCRSEALNIRNVHIEGCLFDNCPRAIGTHTQILNNPFDGIVIVNNTFQNLTSVAIQAENWKNVTISNNRISATPRAIALYSVFGNNGGGFKASVLAKEGGTKTDISDAYQTPYHANIEISGNTITGCGTVKDVYADYKPLAISVMGKNLTAVAKANADGSSNYPKGDYYIDGVTIKNNTIETAGHGVYLEDVRNAVVSSNSITCKKSDLAAAYSNPLTTLTCSVTTISGNAVNAAPYHGMELAESKIGSIKSNSITGVGVDGIILEAETTVTSGISGNTIAQAGANGVNIRPNCAAGTVSGNIIYDCKKNAIQQEKNSKATIGENYFKVAEMTSLSLSESDVTLGEGEKLALSVSYAPVNAVAKFTWTSSAPQIAAVNDSGMITAAQFGEADITVKSVNGKTAVCHVTVRPAPKSVKLDANMLTIGQGESVALGASLSEGSVAHKIAFLSNNTGAVSVSDQGIVTGTGTGTATVVAKTFNGKHANCNVIVKKAPYDIWFDNREISLGVDEIAALNVLFPEGSASHSMVFRSEDDSIVSVEQNGVIRAKSEGEAVITATAFNGAKAICYVTVKGAPQTVSFSQEEYAVSVGEELTPEVLFGGSTASHALSFQSSDPDVCRVDKATGALTPKSAGTVTLTVKTYNRVSATCRVVVSKAEE